MCTVEAPIHQNIKQSIVDAQEYDTQLVMRRYASRLNPAMEYRLTFRSTDGKTQLATSATPSRKRLRRSSARAPQASSRKSRIT